MKFNRPADIRLSSNEAQEKALVKKEENVRTVSMSLEVGEANAS